jgi:protein SCO1
MRAASRDHEHGGPSELARGARRLTSSNVAWLAHTVPHSDIRAVVRYLGAGILAVVSVVTAGVWLGHRLDPTWAGRHAPLRRSLPFPLPALDLGAGGPAWSRDVAGRPWILELRFPGCGADDNDVTARVATLAGAVRARTGRDPGWVTLLVGELPGSASRSPRGGAPARHVAPLDPRVLAGVAAGMGLADSARAAADGLLDARHWMFAVDAAGWARGAADVTDGQGWDGLQAALLAAAGGSVAGPSESLAWPAPSKPPQARLPPFDAVDHEGRPVRSADLVGHPLVVDFIFTRCLGACPMLTARLATLRRMVPDPDARFVSFSVDPAYDTPAVLRAYAGRWGSPDPRWRLLATDAATVRAVARGLGEVVAQTDGGPILHSDHFTLLDRSGLVCGRIASGDPDALRGLADQLRGLGAPAAGAVRPQTHDAAPGARLYSSLGCQGCHEDAALAPALRGVAGHPVRLADGRTVRADEGYLRQSITAPVAAVVDGFRPTMPSYGGLLAQRDLDALVEYLESLRN